MLRWCRLVLLMLLLSLPARAAIDAVCSHTVFHQPGAQTPAYAEVFFEVNPASLRFAKNEQGWQGAIYITASFSADTGLVLRERSLLQTPPVADMDQVFNQRVAGLQRYSLQPGAYTFTLLLQDRVDSNNTFIYTKKITVPVIAGKAAYSPVQLLDTFAATRVNSPYRKGNMEQLPMSHYFLDERRYMLHYYAELYHADKIPATEWPLTQQVFISRQKPGLPGMPGTNHTDTLRSPATTLPALGSLPVASLASGNYYVNIVLHNNKGQEIVSTNTFFQRSNPDPQAATDTGATVPTIDTGIQQVTTLNLANTFVAKYSAAQVKAILKMLLPISTPLERQNIVSFQKRPDELYSKYFIYNFWVSRDKKDPKKAWDAYADRVREVNKLFGAGANMPGYETDRGLVYLKYGKPQERIQVLNEVGAKPYEIWHYDKPGGQALQGDFLFYQPGYSTNDYRILHTTVIGEMRNTNWRLTLYTNGATNNPNSRAEQYLRNR